MKNFLHLLKLGEKSALEEVYRRHLRRVMSYFIGSMNIPHFDAEDLAHEVFASLFTEEVRSRLNNDEAFGAYIMGIARNMAMNYFRRMWTAVKYEDDVQDLFYPSTPVGGLDEADRIRAAVKDFFNSLDDVERGVVEHFYLGNAKKEEIRKRHKLTDWELRQKMIGIKEKFLSSLTRLGITRENEVSDGKKQLP